MAAHCACARLHAVAVAAYNMRMARKTAHDIAQDPRARQLLRTLVARHIRSGEPVGSQTLAKHAGLDVSPATIRNILATLEDAGLLAAPHSSAGRVPTAQGYRLFVDTLLQVKPLAESETRNLRSSLQVGAGTRALLDSTSELLSTMTHFAGMVSVPKRESFAFRQIDFVALDPQRVLAIVVFADGEVQNRVVQLRRVVTPSELEQAANYLNTHFAGQPLGLIRARLLGELRAARSEMERLLASSLELAEQAFAPANEDDMLVAGQTRLLGLQDMADMEQLRALFEAFAEKRELLQLLERTAKAPGMRVFIGEEAGLAPLEGMSLVAAPYGRDGRVLGVLGVIGPSRMAYERVIPVVDAAAALLGAALNPES